MSLLLAAVLLAAVTGRPADRLVAPQPITLVAEEGHWLSTPLFNYWGDPQCDAEGTLYFHAGSGFSGVSVLGLPEDESKAVWYRPLPKDADGFLDFFASPDGRAYALVDYANGEASVLRFATDGSVDGRTDLNMPTGLRPQKFAVFANGFYLVSGLFEPKESEGKWRGVTVIFDAAGNLVRNLDLLALNLSTKDVQGHSQGGLAMGLDGNATSSMQRKLQWYPLPETHSEFYPLKSQKKIK